MSVHQRKTKKGSWYVHLQINGKRLRKVIPEARTRREAEKAERVILRELFENRWGIGGREVLLILSKKVINHTRKKTIKAIMSSVRH